MLGSSENTDYPENVNILAEDSSTLTIKVYAYTGTGEFELSISEINEDSLPTDFEIVNLESGIDLYQIEGNGEFDAQLDVFGDYYYMAVVDTKNPLLLTNALSSGLHQVLNPHLLADSFDEFSENTSISYTLGEGQEHYLAVYHMDIMTGNGFVFPSGYKLKASHTLNQLTLGEDYTLPYKRSATYVNDGDGKWNEGELHLIKDVTITGGETFDFILEMNKVQEGMVVLFFEGENADDVNNVVESLNNFIIPDGLHNFGYTFYTEIMSLSFQPLVDETFNIAIYSDDVPTNVQYTVYTSQDVGGSINTNAVDSPTGLGSILLGLVAGLMMMKATYKP